MGGRLQRRAGLREAELRVANERGDRPHPLARRHRGEHLLRAVESQHGEPASQEAALPAVLEQPDEDEIGLDEDALELAVQPVDECLHLLRHT